MHSETPKFTGLVVAMNRPRGDPLSLSPPLFSFFCLLCAGLYNFTFGFDFRRCSGSVSESISYQKRTHTLSRRGSVKHCIKREDLKTGDVYTSLVAIENVFLPYSDLISFIYTVCFTNVLHSRLSGRRALPSRCNNVSSLGAYSNRVYFHISLSASVALVKVFTISVKARRYRYLRRDSRSTFRTD